MRREGRRVEIAAGKEGRCRRREGERKESRDSGSKKVGEGGVKRNRGRREGGWERDR